MGRTPDDFPPEGNDEQREGDQAQDVADDALILPTDSYEESERGGSSNPASLIPDDTPDLVDTMNQMVRSGRIDNGAFVGEPMHDDEEEVRGITDEDEDGL